MTFEFHPAKRANVPLLVGVAGGTGSGKTMSALLLARGIAGGQPFAGIDTENGRMSHYADLFPELHVAQIAAPFRPDRYSDAIESAVAHLETQGVPVDKRVTLVDSMSHEWAGDGGCLDWHDELMGGDQKKNLSAWIAPKKSHKAMVTRLLQARSHVLLCFRAEPKVEAIVKDGKTVIVPKASITGLDGWLPISERNLPYELTASFLLMADNPGVPRPIKLEVQHRPFVPLDRPLDEQVGARLAEWARGSTSEPVAVPDVGELTEELLRVTAGLEERDQNPIAGARATAEEAIAANRQKTEGNDAAHAKWLLGQITRATKNLEAAPV